MAFIKAHILNLQNLNFTCLSKSLALCGSVISLVLFFPELIYRICSSLSCRASLHILCTLEFCRRVKNFLHLVRLSQSKFVTGI